MRVTINTSTQNMENYQQADHGNQIESSQMKWNTTGRQPAGQNGLETKIW